MRDKKEIANLITRLTKAKGISVNHMLVSSGAGADFVNNLKKGQSPSAMKLKLVADYLGVTSDYLLSSKKINEFHDLDDNAFTLPPNFRDSLSCFLAKELDLLQEDIDIIVPIVAAVVQTLQERRNK